MKTTTPMLAAALALLALPSPAAALTQKQLEQCIAGPDHPITSPDIAIQACTAVIRSGRFSGKQSAVAFFVRGVAYALKREDDRALADFNEAIRLDPDDRDAFYERGYTYADKHDYDRAIADFNEAIRLGPNIPDSLAGRGRAYCDKEDYDRGIADLDKAIGLDPKNYHAFRNRGYCYALQGNNDDRAIDDLSEAIRIEPEDSQAFFYRGVVYKAKGDYDRAAADFRRAADLGDAYAAAKLKELLASPPPDHSQHSGLPPDQSVGTSHTASTAADEECTEDSKSIPACTRLIASGRLSGKELAEAYFNRGFGYWLDQKYKLAIRDYSSAAQLVPDHADYYWWRGCAYKDSGNRRAAKADFERGRRLGYQVLDGPCGL